MLTEQEQLRVAQWKTSKGVSSVKLRFPHDELVKMAAMKSKLPDSIQEQIHEALNRQQEGPGRPRVYADITFTPEEMLLALRHLRKGTKRHEILSLGMMTSSERAQARGKRLGRKRQTIATAQDVIDARDKGVMWKDMYAAIGASPSTARALYLAEMAQRAQLQKIA